MMFLHKVLNKVVAGLCLCILAAVLTGCGDDVGGEHCDGVNEFLDRFSGNTPVATVNAAEPVITGPSGRTVPIGPEGATCTIAVAASVTDGGTLSYQWFRGAESAVWTEIEGATDSIYEVRADSLATYHFYVEVTNTNNSVNGSKTARRSSTPVMVSVNVVVNAQVPEITAQPVGGTVRVTTGGTYPLSVTAVVGSGGLTYQWFSNIDSSNTGGVPIQGATEAEYAALTGNPGTSYYYVAVTNTIAENGDGGRKTESVVSDVAVLTVNNDRNALTPGITAYPGDTTVTAGTPLTLTAAASVADADGQLAYTWYRSNTRNNTGGDWAGSGASHTVPTAASDTGTAYYYVIVTNTIPAGENVGETTAITRGAAVEVRVNAVSTVETYTLTINNPGAYGTVLVNNAQNSRLDGLRADTVIHIQATEAAGYRFTGWTVSGDGTVADSTLATTTITIRGNVTLTANFEQVPTPPLLSPGLICAPGEAWVINEAYWNSYENRHEYIAYVFTGDEPGATRGGGQFELYHKFVGDNKWDMTVIGSWSSDGKSLSAPDFWMFFDYSISSDIMTTTFEDNIEEYVFTKKGGGPSNW